MPVLEVHHIAGSKWMRHNKDLVMQVKSMAASGVVSFAVLTDGTVWAWGSSKRGQLGLGLGCVQALQPQRLAGLEGITSVSAGWGHACALRGAALPPCSIIARADPHVHCELATLVILQCVV